MAVNYLYKNYESISEKNFNRISKLIQTNIGIKMPESKRIMLESRLQKRLRVLQIKSFQEYCQYLFSKQGFNKEIIHLFDIITTNKTDFFREPTHYDYLIDYVVPALINEYGIGIKQPLRLWSAGCATGEEPYTIAMVLQYFKESFPNFQFSIEASDIAISALEKAKMAIYREDKILPIPVIFKKKYLLKSKDKSNKLIRIAPQIRKYVKFVEINLMDNSYNFNRKFDIIFCRNVIIYFTRETQEKLLNKLHKYLIPGGFLFLGHSETLCGMNIPLKTVSPTVYKKIKSEE